MYHSDNELAYVEWFLARACYAREPENRRMLRKECGMRFEGGWRRRTAGVEVAVPCAAAGALFERIKVFDLQRSLALFLNDPRDPSKQNWRRGTAPTVTSVAGFVPRT
ncbi:hypothetical protein NDU88_003386 [Pleurodeles waltl]|uniref:Uncharacterized protein n=1 Tax=Pleurodeles waltl TaxID=8319 RepID=A0AAV7UCB7_PLEWA|nr:hypothetical protein NDU88_003386 [Pleurodeles waltl]